MKTFNVTTLAAALEPVEGAYDSTNPLHRALRFLSESTATCRADVLDELENADLTLYYTREFAEVYRRFPVDVNDAIAGGCETVEAAALCVLYDKTRDEVTALLHAWEAEGLLPSDDDEGEE